MMVCLAARQAQAAPLRLAVETSTAMPMADVRGDQLVGGLHRDLGLALGRQLGRDTQFQLVPRKRLAALLEQGDADLACHFLPEWLPGHFDWTTPFLPNALLLISDARIPQPESLAALKNTPVGTVLGFAYPEAAAVLGNQFVRDDAPSMLSNLRKMAAGHLSYALIGKVFLDYQLHTGAFNTLRLNPPLVLRQYLAQCAVSRHGQVTVTEVNKAIQVLKRSHRLDEMYARYL